MVQPSTHALTMAIEDLRMNCYVGNQYRNVQGESAVGNRVEVGSDYPMTKVQW